MGVKLRNGGVHVQVDGLPLRALGARPRRTSRQLVAITIATGQLLGHHPADVSQTASQVGGEPRVAHEPRFVDPKHDLFDNMGFSQSTRVIAATGLVRV